MGRPKEDRDGKILEQQLTKLKNREFEFRNKATADSKDLIYMHILNNHAVFTEDNAVELLTDGRQKFDRLLRDIENAKDHIHLQYYIYKGDEIGKSCGTR